MSYGSKSKRKSYGKSNSRKKKTYRSARKGRRGGRIPKSNISIMPSTIVSDRTFTKLSYNERFIVSLSAGTPDAEYTFRGNGAYDPYYTTGGNSCLGFATWAALYDRYKVHSSKINIKLISTGSTNATSTFELAVIPVTSQVTLDTLDDYVNQPYSKYQLVAIASKLGELTHYMSTEKVLGLDKKAVDVSPSYQSLVTTVPSIEWAWQVFVGTVDYTSTTTCLMYVTIDYYIEFFDRVVLELS